MKNIDALFQYYFKLKESFPSLQLIIIGDGPESFKVNKYAKEYDDIFWRGAIMDEKKVSDEMRRSHLVFVPGHSGLSIVHAFCYGKPYLTFSTYRNHPPEIDYLIDGKNGYLLSGNISKDCEKIQKLLIDKELYSLFCLAAYRTAKDLSVEIWCDQILMAFRP